MYNYICEWIETLVMDHNLDPDEERESIVSGFLSEVEKIKMWQKEEQYSSILAELKREARREDSVSFFSHFFRISSFCKRIF